MWSPLESTWPLGHLLYVSAVAHLVTYSAPLGVVRVAVDIVLGPDLEGDQPRSRLLITQMTSGEGQDIKFP